MRDHARIQLSIWDDPDFIALTCAQQIVYLALTSSPDLSYAGVLPLLPGRIARCSRDLTKAKVTTGMRELEAARFLVIDDETDEVLVRSYVRHDGIVKQPNVLAGSIKAWARVRSTAIRKAILDEYRRAFTEGFPEGFKEGYLRALHRSFPEGFPEGFSEPFANSPSPFPLPPSPDSGYEGMHSLLNQRARPATNMHAERETT